MITVIDYGMGNLRSVVKSIELYTEKVQLSSNPASIENSEGIIMPGDGAFGLAMKNLTERKWIEPLKEYIISGGFFLGICLGYQLLFSSSEEFGNHKGLDIVEGDVVKFKIKDKKVPHMGWNEVMLTGSSKFLSGIETKSFFYFIHSYYPIVHDDSWILGEAEYGINFPCIIGRENLIATQFHPEKSHSVGLRIVENFVRHVCS